MSQSPRLIRRIGLFGGSFDPVHTGHLLVAQTAYEELELDRLSLIPAARSPFKTDSSPEADPLRLRMLRAAFAGFTWVTVDDQELRRGGISYSIDSVRRYKVAYPDATLFYLIGSDHLSALEKWREVDALNSLAEFAVIPRPGSNPADTEKLESRFRLKRLKGAPTDISSSMIRDRIRDQMPLGALAPTAVEEIIRNYRLYI